MPIEFDCSHCGKHIKAPSDSGGRRGKCPFCKNSVYIPAEVDDDDLLDLEPEDEEYERRREQRRRELLDADRDLLADSPGKEDVGVPLDQKDNLSSDDLRHFVINYCLDMAGSKLEQAEANAKKLKQFGPLGKQALEDFEAEGIESEPALQDLPRPLVEGFLKRLGNQLD